MNVQQILQLSPDDVNKMTRQELSDITTILGSAVNKRVSRVGVKLEKISQMDNPLDAEQVVSPALRGLMESGGKISVKGKNLNDIRSEFKRARRFLTSKTSTQKGFQEFRKETFERIGGGKMTIADEKQFWHTYNKLLELEPTAIETYGSSQLQQFLRSVQLTGADDEEMANNALDMLNDAYRQAQMDADENSDWDGWSKDDLTIYGNNSGSFNHMSASQIGAMLNRGEKDVLSERRINKPRKKRK